MAGETLEQAGFARIDAEVVELHLRLGPGQRGRPLEGGGVAMLVDEVEHRLAGSCDHRPEGDAHDRAGRDPHAAAQGEDRIEHGADRVRQRPAVDHRDRRSDAVAAAEEAGPVGLDLRLSHGLAIDDGQMRRPDFRLARRRAAAASPGWRPTSARYSVSTNSFDEGRMRDVVGLRRQHQLGIGGDVDLARPAAGIGDRDAADLGIVLGRDEHLQRGRERSVAAREFGAILVEDDVIGVGLDAARLEARRPHVAAADVARKT